MVDVDHFKAVNDTRGHEAGDLVLQAVANRLRAACRTEDLAGRWGGEEFLVIAPMTDLAGGARLGERIRSSVGAAVVSVADGADIDVTVSVGVAAGEGGEDVLAEADAALYAAKRAGRNRVVTAGEADPDRSAGRSA